ncbi:hypothetical protein B0H14DRAFT_2650966 [Mycena olivaceomarginata]|nr:hypothetical protein B0H14DRAFT_2650966 [Mycena olivaceomarginata]
MASVLQRLLSRVTQLLTEGLQRYTSLLLWLLPTVKPSELQWQQWSTPMVLQNRAHRRPPHKVTATPPPNMTASLIVMLADATIALGTTVTPSPSNKPPTGEITTPTPPGDDNVLPSTMASLTVMPADATIIWEMTLTPPPSTEPPAGAITTPAMTPATVPAPPDLITLRPGSLISDKGDVYLPPLRPEILKHGKEKKARRKAGEPAGKPGRVSWIWGTKLKFFESQKDDWLKAHEQKVAGAFYMKMAKLYIIKYGCHLAADDDFAYDVADPPDWVANKVVNEQLSPEETMFRQEYHTILQDLLHFYSEKRYNEHIKPWVEARKKSLAVHAEMTDVKAPAAITIQNEVTKECWNEESDLYMDSLLREREREHEIRLRDQLGSMGRYRNAEHPYGKDKGFSRKRLAAAGPRGLHAGTEQYGGLCPPRLLPLGGGGGGVNAAGQGGINSVGEGDVPTTASQPAPISEGSTGGASNVGRDEGGGDGMDQGEENKDPTVEGQAWGIEWASLVDKYYDFEAAWGHRDVSGQITTESRPKALEWWISRGRKWEKTVDIGMVGNAKAPGTFVSGWWGLVGECAAGGEGGLASDAETAQQKWPAAAHGVLAVAGGKEWRMEWLTAVEDMGDVFTELLRPGLIAKLKTTETQGKEAPKGKKRKAAETGEIQVEGRRATW